MQTTAIELFLLEFHGALVTLCTKEVSSYRNRVTCWSADEASGQRLAGTSPVPPREAKAHTGQQSPWPPYSGFTEYTVKQRMDGGSGRAPAHRPPNLCWELCVLMSSLSHCGFKFHDSRALGTFVPLIQCSVLTAEAVPGTNPPE